MGHRQSTCEECDGKRFQAWCWSTPCGGTSPLAAMSVTEARIFGGDAERRRTHDPRRLSMSARLLSLGRRSPPVRGERQRVTLATRGREGQPNVPRATRHAPRDVDPLPAFRRSSLGKSVIVIEPTGVHAHADLITTRPAAATRRPIVLRHTTVSCRPFTLREHLAAYVQRCRASRTP